MKSKNLEIFADFVFINFSLLSILFFLVFLLFFYVSLKKSFVSLFFMCFIMFCLFLSFFFFRTLKMEKNRRKVLFVKNDDFLSEKTIFGPQRSGKVRNGSFEGDPAFMFFSFFLLQFYSKMFLLFFHMTTLGGIAGIGLGPYLGEHDSTPQSGVEAPRLLKRSLSRWDCCCCCCCCCCWWLWFRQLMAHARLSGHEHTCN